MTRPLDIAALPADIVREIPPPTSARIEPSGARGDIDNWPAPLGEAAFHGIIGQLVRMIEPHTEADPAALLVQLLAGCGSVIGPGPYFVTDGARQRTNLFVVVVGRSAMARKGTSWTHCARILGEIDPEWTTRCAHDTGLSSGEGMVNAVRDAHEVRTKNKKGEIEVATEEGIADKRYFVAEGEFSRVLSVKTREGNTLSTTLRNAWDGKRLEVTTRANSLIATGAHIGIAAHITEGELSLLLNGIDVVNGFANRFLWACARRSKTLPRGSTVDPYALDPLIQNLRAAITTARTLDVMWRDAEAEDRWEQVYGDLSKDEPGPLAAILARGPAQVVRLSMIYALLEGSPVVGLDHLEAALAVWNYCTASASRIFGGKQRSDAEILLAALLAAGGQGLSRHEIHRDTCGGNWDAERIERALRKLERTGLAFMKKIPPAGGSGRPTERWYAARAE